MNKPTKIKIDYSLGRRDLIWNNCCAAWEAYLKDVRLDEWLEEQGIDGRPNRA